MTSLRTIAKGLDYMAKCTLLNFQCLFLLSDNLKVLLTCIWMNMKAHCDKKFVHENNSKIYALYFQYGDKFGR